MTAFEKTPGWLDWYANPSKPSFKLPDGAVVPLEDGGAQPGLVKMNLVGEPAQEFAVAHPGQGQVHLRAPGHFLIADMEHLRQKPMTGQGAQGSRKETGIHA